MTTPRHAARVTALAVAILALGAPAAMAATLTNAGGTLTYTGGDAANDVTFTRPAPNTVRVRRDTVDDSDAITATGCVESDPGVEYDCGSVNAVVANGNGGADAL